MINFNSKLRIISSLDHPTNIPVTHKRQLKKQNNKFFVGKLLTILAITFCFSFRMSAQTRYIDSLVNYLNTHPKVDSTYIHVLHKLSYRLSETDTKQSFHYYEKVAALSDSLNFPYGKALAQINLGILLENAANLEASNDAYFKAIDYAEVCGSLRLKAVSLNNVGDNFKTLKDYPKCRQYTLQAIEINTQLKAWRGVAINYELLFECDFEDGLFQDAKNKLDIGMPFAILADESYIYAQFYLGFGKLQAKANRPDSAAIYFDRAMAQAKLENELRNEYFVDLAEVQYLNNIPPARKLQLLSEALKLARQTDYLEGVSNAARDLSSAYEALNNKDSSLYFYRIHREAADSLFNIHNTRNVTIKESEWMIKRQEIENRHLKDLAQLQGKEITFKNFLLIAGIITLLLTIAIAYFINRSIESKKKRVESSFKQKISETQMQALQAQMNPHFIFNSLNSIENFMMKNDKRMAIDYLSKFSLLMRMFLDSSRNESVPFEKDMEALQLYVELEQLRYNNKFTYESCIDPALREGDYTVPPLLIQPYVENAIVHGFSPSDRTDLHLKVSATLENDYILYAIRDNGIGRKKSEEYKQNDKPIHKSMGMEITLERINIHNQKQQGSGDLVITDLYDDHGKAAGTLVQVRLKII
jgi:Histidine kinase